MTKYGKESFIILILLFITLFTIAYRNILNVGMFAYGDNSPFPESASDAFNTFFYSWQPMSRGINIFQSVYMFFQGVLIFMCVGNSMLAQKIWMFFPVPASFIVMYIFLSRFEKLNINSQFAKFSASFIYAINPMTIGNMLGGAYGFSYGHMLFPLLFWTLYNMLKERSKIRDMLLFTLFLALSLIFGSQILIFIVPFALVLVLINFAFKRDLRLLFRSIGLLSVSFFIASILSLSISYFEVAARYFPGTGSSLPSAVFEQYLNIMEYTFSYAGSVNPIISILSLQWVSRELGYSLDIIVIFAGLVIPLLVFSSLLFTHDKEKSKYITIFGSLALLLISFIYLTKLKYTFFLFHIIPFFFAITNPAPPTMWLVFAYAPLIAIAIDDIQKRIWKSSNYLTVIKNFKDLPKIIPYILFCIIILSAIVIQGWPFFTGDLGLSASRGKVPGLDEYKIPSVFYEAENWIDAKRSSEGFFRTIWLPWTPEGSEIKLRWIDPDTFSVPTTSGLIVEQGISKYVEFTYKSLTDGSSQHIGSLIAPANVKYIIVNLKAFGSGLPTANLYYISGDPKQLVSILNKQKDLKLVYNNTKFVIYENTKYIPHVSAYNNVIFVPLKNSTIYSERLKLMSLLSEIPDFELTNQLLVFGDDRMPFGQKKWFLNNSATVIMPSVESSDEYLPFSKPKKIVSLGSFSLAPQEVIFSDDFSGNINGWTSIRGNWTVKNGKLIQEKMDNSSLRGFLVTGNVTWDNYIIETRIKINSGRYGGITFRYTDNANYYESFIDTEADQVSLRKNVNGENGFIMDSKKYIMESDKQRTSPPEHYGNNVWYKMRVEVFGSSIKVYVDDVLRIEAVDSDLTHGKIGLWSNSAVDEYDGIKVYSIKLHSQFFVENDGYHKIALGAINRIITLNGKEINFNTTENIGTRFKYLQLEEVKPYNIIFSDDFNGNLSGWTSIGGKWTVKNGKLIQEKMDNYSLRESLVTGNVTWNNYIIETRIKINSGRYGGITFRYTDNANYYKTFIDTEADQVSLRKTIKGEDVFIADSKNYIKESEQHKSPPEHYENIVWYNMRVEVFGSSIKVYVDDVLRIEAIDSDLTHGKIGLWSNSAIDEYDGIKVYSVKLHSQFFVENDGYYKIALGTINNVNFLTIDGKEINFNTTEEKGIEFKYYQSDNIYLRSGIHNITITPFSWGESTYILGNTFILLSLPRKAPVDIDGNEINFNTINNMSGEFNYYQSDATYLRRGLHDVNLTLLSWGESPYIFRNNILLFPATQREILKDVLGSVAQEPLGINSNKISPTEYHVDVESEKPVFIVLGEPYHPSWNGYINGEKLEHFPAFYQMNGFYLNKTGNNHITITFEEQKTKNLIMIIWAITWAFLITGIVYTSRRSLIQSYDFLKKIIKKL